MANDTKYGYLISPAPQFLDTNGKPISGGKLKVYIAGTTTKATTYSDWNLTKNTWPIVLDSMGTCQVIVSSANLYKFVLESAEGEEPLVTRDNVAVAYANVDITGIGSEVVNSDGSVDVTATTDPDTGRTTYDVSVKDTVQDLEGLIEDETDRATAAEKAVKTEIVAGDNISVTKTVGADGQDVYTIDGEGEDNLVDDVRVNGTSVVTDKVANIDVPVAGKASPLMDGAASAGASGKFAREDHVHPSDTSREAVANKTSVVQGSSDSKYPTDKAVWNFVNSSIATNTAYYISDNGEPFTSVEELEAYPGIVTNNDYAFVTGVDSAGNTYYDRYKATVRGSTVTWALEYRLNNSSFTAAQWEAINSGITSALVGKIHEHSNKAVLDGITATDVSNWNDKMNKQSAGNASTPIYLSNGVAQEATSIAAATAGALTTPRKIDGVKFDGSGDIVHYGVCSTAGNVQAKVISCPGFVLTTGARIIIKFTQNNNFRELTFNVNDTGAVPVRYFGSPLPTANFLRAGAVYQFVYDGTNYCFVGNFDNNNFVYQSALSTNAEYPIACKNSANQTAENNFVHYASGITMNPSTNKITASGGFVGDLSGNAATASEAASGSTLESKINSKQEAITWMTDAEALQLWTDAWDAAT